MQLWLIPILPLAGFVLNGVLGRRLSKSAVKAIAVGSVLLSFLWVLKTLSGLGVFGGGNPLETPYVEHYFTWIQSGNLNIGVDFAVDRLTCVMLLVVTGVGSLIHIYAVGYMSHEDGYYRFFAYLNLFMFFMLVLVLAANFLLLFVGWEGVGLCSYLLIGFYFTEKFATDAGNKAFIVNRIGDFGFSLAVFLIAVHFGSLDFATVFGKVQGMPVESSAGWMTAIALLLFVGATGKSAQIPLYVWLPDAMAGPTPVSALIHAATMVTAGVYMVTRMSTLYVHAPEAMAVIAIVGAMTALFAATMGITATDIKKVLAYSTVSQLGYMFAAAGVGAWTAAIFHLMTHAFFKAILFLGAGSVIHGQHGEQDITKMGALRSKLPVTFATFLTATLAIAGIFPLAGFFSKDEILWGAWSSGNKVVWGVLALSAGLTAFYMFRLTFLVFYGNYRGDPRTFHHAHESPRAMTVPLMTLAALSVVGGWIGIPAVIGTAFLGGDVDVFHRWLQPAVAAGPAEAGAGEAAGASPEFALMAAALAIALAGLGIALLVYRTRDGAAASIAARFPPIYAMWRNLYWVDELSEAAILKPFYAVSRFSAGFDRFVIDGLVNAAAIVADITGQILKLFQTGYVRNYALVFLMGVVAMLVYLATV